MACSGECFSLVLLGKNVLALSGCWTTGVPSLFLSPSNTQIQGKERGKQKGGGLSYFSSCSYPFTLNTLSIDSSLFLPCTRIGRQLLCRDLKLYFQPSDL